MKKLALALLTSIVFLPALQAQKSATVIYGELGGPGIASFNVDMRFAKKEDGFGFRAGVGGFSIEENSGILVVPLGINFIVGKDGKNYFETGAGVSFLSDNNESNNNQIFGATFGHLTIGYRRQRKEGGFFFKAAVTPVFGTFGFFPFYGGVGFGYKF